MSSFGHAMVLISIVIGLGITHILQGLGAAVHRLRGHGRPIKLDATYLAWVAIIFSWMVQFWWWEFRWNAQPHIGINLYLFFILYSVALFLAAVILVPDRLQPVNDSWDYFLSIRGWFFGCVLALNVIDLCDSFLKGMEWGTRLPFVVWWIALTVACIVGLKTTNRRVHLAMSLLFLIWINLFSYFETGFLGLGEAFFVPVAPSSP